MLEPRKLGDVTNRFPGPKGSKTFPTPFLPVVYGKRVSCNRKMLRLSGTIMERIFSAMAHFFLCLIAKPRSCHHQILLALRSDGENGLNEPSSEGHRINACAHTNPCYSSHPASANAPFPSLFALVFLLILWLYVHLPVLSTHVILPVLLFPFPSLFVLLSLFLLLTFFVLCDT